MRYLGHVIQVKAIKEDQEEVALQAIEFWSTVCDTEADLLDAADPNDPCHNFIKAAAPHLTPILLEQLTKQEEGLEQDDTGWNISTSAGTCLGLAARVIGGDIIQLVGVVTLSGSFPSSLTFKNIFSPSFVCVMHCEAHAPLLPFPQVMPFVQANISKNTAAEDWRLREAATFAFGLVLDGPEPSALLDTVKQALVFLLQVCILWHLYRSCLSQSHVFIWPVSLGLVSILRGQLHAGHARSSSLRQGHNGMDHRPDF